MTDKANNLIGLFFIYSGLTTFCGFRCPPQLSISDFGCSTVLAKVNCKNQHLKFEYCLESLTENVGLFCYANNALIFW